MPELPTNLRNSLSTACGFPAPSEETWQVVVSLYAKRLASENVEKSAKYWQHIYADAVVLTQALQRHGVDPTECATFSQSDIHTICLSTGILTFDEEIVFGIATQMLEERHSWSYSDRN